MKQVELFVVGLVAEAAIKYLRPSARVVMWDRHRPLWLLAQDLRNWAIEAAECDAEGKARPECVDPSGFLRDVYRWRVSRSS